MAIFVDLSDEDENENSYSSPNIAHVSDGGAYGYHHFSTHEHSNYLPGMTSQSLVAGHGVNITETEDVRNLGSQIPTSREADEAFMSVTKVFAAYPIVRSIVSHLDYTDLYNLSSTCRQIRANLLINRAHFLQFTMTCKKNLRHRITIDNGESGPETISKTNCTRDLVNLCNRCQLACCRNCRSKSTQHYIVDQRRMICETCQKIPISTINDDISAFECKCSTPNNMWICQSCTNTHTPQIFRLKTESRGQVASRQCHRGLDCYGTGWCEISTRWAYQIGAHLYDAYSIDPRYLTQVRTVCGFCNGFIFGSLEKAD